MKIENEILYIDKTDLDHILGEMDLQEYLSVPPSELFLKGLEVELQMNGLDDRYFRDILIENIRWD